MKTNYFTYFDSGYLAQGLSLIESTFHHCDVDCFIVFCLDEISLNYLTDYSYHNYNSKLVIVDYNTLLDFNWYILKTSRTKSEFFWSLTPLFVSYSLKVSGSEFLVYVDSDMFFLDSDQRIIRRFALSGKDVFITPHYYLGEFDYSAFSGKYCVQYLIFKVSSSGDIVTNWLQNCINECTSQFRPGGIGDQRYLTFWDKLFPNRIYIAENYSEFVAPWNIIRDGLSNCVVYHFQGFRVLGNGYYLTNQSFLVPRIIKKSLYKDYILIVNRYYTDLVFNKVLPSVPILNVFINLFSKQFYYWISFIYKRFLNIISLNFLKL